MESMWAWTKLGLILGGIAIGIAGLVWYKTARLAQAFGRPVNAGRGLWVMATGLLMLAAGLTFFYFQDSKTPSPSRKARLRGRRRARDLLVNS